MFGVAEDKVPNLASAFDMMNAPITFLVVSLAMGALHLLCGMGIKFYILWREKKRFEAIFDVGSWFVLFAGIGVYFIHDKAGLITAGVGVLMLVLTQGRAAKNPIMKLAKGVMSLYDLISYASDLLSYSRILALSLASAVIASVVNIFATMNGLSVAGVIMFIFVGLIGHLLNFAVNILGTYVHTSRLQYIEFFGKFYEGGGREFQPLTPDTKFVSFM
jgi:V/A-type H+-transporting ATPase subunit I